MVEIKPFSETLQERTFLYRNGFSVPQVQTSDCPIDNKKSLPHKYHLEVTLDAFHKKLGLSITATPV